MFGYQEAPQVRWLGLGPTYAGLAGGQPPQVGAWSELVFSSAGRLTVHPTTDGTVDGEALFERTVGMVILPLLGLLGGSGDDGDAVTGAALVTMVHQVIDEVTFDHPKEFTFELARFVEIPIGGGPPLELVPDGTVAFITIFGIPA